MQSQKSSVRDRQRERKLQLLIQRHQLVLEIELCQELRLPLALPKSHAMMWSLGQVGLKGTGQTLSLFRFKDRAEE